MLNNYPFTSFKITPTLDAALNVNLQWQLDPTFQDKAPFNFYVETSETPDFSSITSTIDAGNNFYVTDDSYLIQGFITTMMYRVKLVTGSGKVYYSAPLHFDSQVTNSRAYRIAKEITRKECIRFLYSGQKAWAVKRKLYGELSESDVDPISGVPISNFETSDRGTGLVGGYYKPLSITYSREDLTTSTAASNEGFGILNVEQMNIRMLGFPLVNPYDVLVTDNGPRYLFSSVDTTYMPGTDIPIIQKCVVKLLPPTDPLYSIPIV